MEARTGSEIAAYRIEDAIGRGGMGVVYRAVDQRLGRKVALKVIAPEQAGDEAFRKRFIAESKAAASIDHPNVLPVYEAGEEDGVLYLAARLVEGSDLGELIESEGPLDPERAIDLVAQVGAALDTAHAHGLVHRDVKPANVLVTPAAPAHGEHCYLTDFGLAKRGGSASGLTATGQFVGTLDYVAPEQIQDQDVDGRTDVYALGAMLFECLTASAPFERDTQVALMWAHLNDPPPSVTERSPDCPAALDGPIADAMAKDPEERLSSCAELTNKARATLASGAASSGTGAPPTVRSERAAPKETVEAAGAPKTRAAGADRPAAPPTRTAHEPGEEEREEPGRRRFALLLGGAAAVLVATAAVVLGLLGGGGGDAGQGGGAAAAVGLSNETIGLTAGVGGDVRRLASRVGDGEGEGLADEFEDSEQAAGALAADIDGSLSADAPGRTGLLGAAGGLEEIAGQLVEVAGDPDRPGAVGVAREARDEMESVITELESALREIRDSLAGSGRASAERELSSSLEQLEENRSDLTNVFDALISELRSR